MVYLALVAAVVAVVAGAVRTQGGPTANLIENAALRTHLKTWAAGNPCPAVTNDGVKTAMEEIKDYGYLVYVLNTRRITKTQALNNYSINAVVNETLVESTKTPDTAVARDKEQENWGVSKVVYSRTQVFAVNNGESVDYYHWEFHLNLQGRTISSRANYVAAMKAISCSETLDWVKRHFP